MSQYMTYRTSCGHFGDKMTEAIVKLEARVRANKKGAGSKLNVIPSAVLVSPLLAC
jgi:hypothetical protein